jgi:uncharacterized protein HemY
MKYILESLLHIFVIFMMVVFAIGCILAATGTFDHWTERYKLKRRRRRLLKGNLSNKKTDDIKANNTLYYPAKPDNDSITP